MRQGCLWIELGEVIYIVGASPAAICELIDLGSADRRKRHPCITGWMPVLLYDARLL